MKTFSCGLRNRPHRKGQELTEFALIATVFLLFSFGVMDAGSAVYCYNAVSSTAREASRYAIVHSPTSPNPATSAQIRQVVLNYTAGMNPDQVTVNSSWPADSNLPTKQDAQVQVTYQYQLSIPFLKAVTLNLTSTSRVLVSQ